MQTRVNTDAGSDKRHHQLRQLKLYSDSDPGCRVTDFV